MLIKLRVHPGAKTEEIRRKAPDLFEIFVRAPAEEGRANAACLRLLGRELGIQPGRIRIVKGGKSPSKIVEVP
ncbi:MAG: DUF167 domain-containing protein [Elusimicrobia bacterium]|nr:DUF167 domain-containing protein [Elusimicrobiota bacterium]